MNKCQQILELFQDFNWEKINKGDAHLLSTLPIHIKERPKMPNLLTLSQKDFVIDNNKEHEVVMKGMNTSQHPSTAFSIGTWNIPLKNKTLAEEEETPDDQDNEVERQHNGSSDTVSKLQKKSQSQYSHPANAGFDKEIKMNKSQELLELYNAALPPVLDPSNSQNLVDLYKGTSKKAPKMIIYYMF